MYILFVLLVFDMSSAGAAVSSQAVEAEARFQEALAALRAKLAEALDAAQTNSAHDSAKNASGAPALVCYVWATAPSADSQTNQSDCTRPALVRDPHV